MLLVKPDKHDIERKSVYSQLSSEKASHDNIRTRVVLKQHDIMFKYPCCLVNFAQDVSYMTYLLLCFS